jgi:ATP-binding cassette subfamily B protein
MRTLLENVGQIYRNMLFLGDLFEFLDLEPTVREAPDAKRTPDPLQQGVRFRDVTFRYPESERMALDSFNLMVPAGQITAIVGPNGAGKTTLLKLLCRFYDPQAGLIELDGTDLREFSLSTLRRAITVLFQRPVPYQDTAFRNVTFGDLSAEPGLDAVQDAARAAGADSIVDRLPDGWDTLLGKWFKGGTDLSVGEWQRMALARAFLRQASIIILDEPTSAMDPWAETDWLARFRTLAKGRTAVIITHRFTTAMHADVIHVMDEGRVVESGSHGELLAMDGRYAQSWHAQMRIRKAGVGREE